MSRLKPEIHPQVQECGEFNAQACMNCGTCTALCPMGLTQLPREVFRYAILGMEAKLQKSTATVFSCLLCRMCQVNCPAEVKIADNVRTLRVYLNREQHGL